MERAIAINNGAKNTIAALATRISNSRFPSEADGSIRAA